MLLPIILEGIFRLHETAESHPGYTIADMRLRRAI